MTLEYNTHPTEIKSAAEIQCEERELHRRGEIWQVLQVSRRLSIETRCELLKGATRIHALNLIMNLGLSFTPALAEEEELIIA